MKFLVSFMCLLKNKEQRFYVTFDELFYFFYMSWISAFTILAHNLVKEKEEFIKKGLDIPSPNQISDWAKKYKNDIKTYLENSLRECNIDYSKEISFNQYCYWTNRDPQFIQVCFDDKFLTIATNLNSLELVEFIS